MKKWNLDQKTLILCPLQGQILSRFAHQTFNPPPFELHINPNKDESFREDLYAICFASKCDISKNPNQTIMEPRDPSFASMTEEDLPEYGDDDY